MKGNTESLLNKRNNAASSAASETKNVMTEKEKQKLRRSALIKMLAMLVFIGCIIAFGSIAWFTMNKENSAAGMGVKVGQSPFELAVPSRNGAETYYNAKINELGYLTGNDQLSTRSGSVRCVMRDESTNTSADDYRGFRPGSFGSLTFYIVPEAEAAASYNIRLNTKGYCAEFVLDENDEPTKDIAANTFHELSDMADGNPESVYAMAANYLKGHIMFFQDHRELTVAELNGAVDTSLYYSGRISNSFTYSTAEHTATTWNGKTAYEVTVYWIWPNTFGQILLDNENENLYGEAMFSDKQSGDIIPRAELTDYIANNPGYFFSTADLINKSSSELTAMMGTTSLNKTNALLTLSNGYNGADQIIGENVQFVLAEVTVE